jgi:hypothetical protein
MAKKQASSKAHPLASGTPAPTPKSGTGEILWCFRSRLGAVQRLTSAMIQGGVQADIVGAKINRLLSFV